MNDKFTHTQDELDELLTQTAKNTSPNPHFAAELERQLIQTHEKKTRHGRFHFTQKQTISTLAWAALLVVFIIALNWTIKSIAPAPTSVPAANESSTPSIIVTETPDAVETQTTPIANDNGYDWRDTKLYLNVSLPEAPTEANIYVLKGDQPATAEQARALAEQFGIQGDVYVSTNPGTGATEYLVTNGKQSVSVTTDRFFTYTANMARGFSNLGGFTSPNAEATINEFLSSHGFDFPHRVAIGELFGGYVVEPLSPEGYSMRYEFFSSRPMKVILDENGEVLQMEANLMNYEQVGTQTHGIISAEEAFQKLMDDTITSGKIESALSSSSTVQTREWRYSFPKNETITIYGYAYSTPALDPSKPAFNQIDGYTVAGNTSGFEKLRINSFVQATGQFIEENGIEKFNVESWKISDYMQDGIAGNLTRENGQVVFRTEQGEQFIIQPDVPADLPMPYENAFVLGMRKPDNIYEWTLIDDRMNNNGGWGGGGGGGGQGFYKLNLSGTPVPFPPAVPTPGLGDGNYVVQEGDTLVLIAQKFGVSVSELSQANNLSDANIIFIGQQLIVPGAQAAQSEVGQKIEGQQGTINVTIFNKPDGSQRAEYLLSYNPGNSPYPAMMILEGDNLQELQAYQNKPVKVWGTVDRYNQLYSMPVVKVERFEIPYPDLQFQILRGTQQTITVNGKPATLFTTNDGISYVQTFGNLIVDNSLMGTSKDEVLLEALAIPEEILDGYPAIQVFSSALATSPKDGQAVDLTVTADQVNTYDEPLNVSESYTPPTLTIDKVELMYYVTNPHWQVDHLDGSPLYLQPVWRFYGHYDNGGEFEVIVQALKQDYLLPELDPYIQGG